MPKDPQVRESIQLILQNLASHPEYVGILLDRLSNKAQIIRPVYDILQIGFDDYVDLIYRSVSIWRAGGKNIPATLLENGLIEEFINLDPDNFKEILDIVADHPLFISRQSSGFSIIKDLNNEDFLWACHKNPELVRKISENLSYYISLPKDSELKAQSSEELVLSMVNLGISTKDTLSPLFTQALILHIHQLPPLRQFTNARKLFTNAAENRNHLQNLVGKILGQERDLLHQVTEDIINYTTLPAATKGDETAKLLIQERWEDMILSLVELGSQPEVNSVLKEFATEELVNDLYDTAAFKNAQYTRKLVTDLAKDNPQAFKELFGAILSKPYNSSLAPLTRNLLTYFSSTNEQVTENPKIATNLLDSLVKLAQDPEISTKIAPLLSENLVNNIFETFALDEYSEYKPLIVAVAQDISNKPETLASVIKAYEQYKKDGIEGALAILEDEEFISTIASDSIIDFIVDKFNSKTSDESELLNNIEELLVNMPELLKLYKEQFINEVGTEEFLAIEKSIQAAAEITKLRKNANYEEQKETVEDQPKQNDIAIWLRKFATMRPESHNSIINGVNKPKVELFIKNILEKTQHNKNIQELQFYGIGEKEIIEFASKACNPSGLNAIADYLEEPQGFSKNMKLVKICVVTGNIGFAFKHLAIGCGNYFKSISQSPAQEELSSPKKEMSMAEKVLESRRLSDSSKNHQL